MAAQFIVNLLVAMIWLFVTDSYTLNNFVLGFIFGLVLSTFYIVSCQVDSTW